MEETVQKNPSKLGMASVMLRAMLAASGRLWTSPFKGRKGAQNYYKDVIFAMMRSQLGNSSISYLRATTETTTKAYRTFAEQRKLDPESITLPNGTQAHWIGNKNAKKVMLYFHGGGYVMPCLPHTWEWLFGIKELLLGRGEDVGILVLAYDLAPEYKFPTQLTQAVEALRYLVETDNRSTGDITLAGDSAGGNLVIGVLSHLSHTHPSISPLQLSGKLHAAMLISPWCSFNIHTPAFTANAEKDCFDGRSLSNWSEAFLGSSSPFAGDFYSEPVTAPSSWWEKTSEVIDEVLIWGGANEILIDGIEEFARRFTEGFAAKGGKVQTIISPGAAHEEPILEVALGYTKDSGSGSKPALEGWIKAKL